LNLTTKSKDLIEKQEQEFVLKEKESAPSGQTTKSTKNTQTINLNNSIVNKKANQLPVSHNSNKSGPSKKQDETNIRKRTISNKMLKSTNEEKPVSNSTNTKMNETKQISAQVSAAKFQPKPREKIQLVNNSVKKPLLKKSIVNEKKGLKKRFFGTAIVLSMVIFISVSFMLFVWAANQEHLNINDLLSLVNRHFSINI